MEHTALENVEVKMEDTLSSEEGTSNGCHMDCSPDVLIKSEPPDINDDTLDDSSQEQVAEIDMKRETEDNQFAPSEDNFILPDHITKEASSSESKYKVSSSENDHQALVNIYDAQPDCKSESTTQSNEEQQSCSPTPDLDSMLNFEVEENSQPRSRRKQILKPIEDVPESDQTVLDEHSEVSGSDAALDFPSTSNVTEDWIDLASESEGEMAPTGPQIESETPFDGSGSNSQDQQAENKMDNNEGTDIQTENKLDTRIKEESASILPHRYVSTLKVTKNHYILHIPRHTAGPGGDPVPVSLREGLYKYIRTMGFSMHKAGRETGDIWYSCDKCTKVYYKASSLRVHKYYHHGPGAEKYYKCDMLKCTYQTKIRTDFIRHLDVHKKHGQRQRRKKFCMTK